MQGFEFRVWGDATFSEPFGSKICGCRVQGCFGPASVFGQGPVDQLGKRQRSSRMGTLRLTLRRAALCGIIGRSLLHLHCPSVPSFLQLAESTESCRAASSADGPFCWPVSMALWPSAEPPPASMAE